MAQFAVIGLGRFGSTASRELMKMGHTVLGIDIDHKIVDKYADELTQAVIADVTEHNALAELALDNYDVVLVAIGSDFQASLLCVVHLKSLGIEKIWVKATSSAEHLILTKIGVTRIVHPEEEMGIRIAQALSYPMVDDYISLGNGEFIVELTISQRLDGVPIQRITEGHEDVLHPLLLKRKTHLYPHPAADFALQHNDTLIVAGPLATLRALAPRLR